MGILRSDSDHMGLRVGKVTLGQAARDVDADGKPVGEYRWDDGRIPNGVINEDGTITLTEGEA